MFSIVIPLYNKEKYIAKTLQSVLKQTFQDFEIIVVDDGSTDESVKEVEKFDDSRIHIVRQLNAGVAVARNRGIKEGKYNYIAFLDADDEWLPDYLIIIHSLIIKYPECSIFATQYIIKSKTSSQYINTKGLPFDTEGIMDNYFNIASMNTPPLCSSAIVVKNKAINAIGGFPHGIQSGEDLLTWAKLAAIYRIAFSTKHLSIYNNDVENWEAGRPTDSIDSVGMELKKLLITIDYNQRNSLKNYIGFWHKMRASTFIRHNQRFLAIKEVFLSLYYNPWKMKTYLFFPLAFMPNLILKYLFRK